MTSKPVHQCQCPDCQQPKAHPNQQIHHQMNLLLSRLDEQQQRWYVALEAKKLGRGGPALMSRITGMHVDTIRRGRDELDRDLANRPVERVRQPGGGRHLLKKKVPGIVAALVALVESETAGDPMSEKKWVRSSLRQLTKALRVQGYQVGRTTVRRLLKDLDYSLQANRKERTQAAHPDRDRQFRYIERVKKLFQARGQPIISVDTKKKELIGNFKNAGRVWCQQAAEVNVHDFPHAAVGKAVPYGIYDVVHNEGSVYVGTSADTSEFAVEAICRWWEDETRSTFPDESKLLILSDAGGSDGCRYRLWKKLLQEQLADRLGIEVMVCHYPTGHSKWNPIEHRLFSHISINWAGKPLRSFEVMLAYIRGTTTETGLKVKAFLVDRVYEKGIKVSDKEMQQLNLQKRRVCPQWNYVIKPRGTSP